MPRIIAQREAQSSGSRSVITPSGLVIIGTGIASSRLLQALKREGYPLPVTVIGAEAVPFYNRVLLPNYVAGELTSNALLDEKLKEAPQAPRRWYQLRNGASVSAIDPQRKLVELDSGERIGYSQLVLATGSRARSLPVRSAPLEGVRPLRNLEDAERWRTLGRSQRIVVVGGGLLGLEAAHALLTQGHSVTVVHRQAQLLNRQLDEPGSALLAQTLEAQGLGFEFSAGVTQLCGDHSIEAVELNNGRRVACDALLLATGTQARDELARSASLACDDGVLVDEHLRSANERIFALGECAHVNHPEGRLRYGLVKPVQQQADALAATLCGRPTAFRSTATATRLKVAGLTLFSAGNVPAAVAEARVAKARWLRIEHRSTGIYRALAFRGYRLIAAVFLGDAEGSRAAETALSAKELSTAEQQSLLFGQPLAA